MHHDPEITYLNVQQVAERLGVSAASIWRWKRDGDFPRAVKLGGRTTRWKLADVEAWEASRQFTFARGLLVPPGLSLSAA
ncbi:helix-turn-helix transcriptional regulator [Salipiger sp.]|uniref:helix-turn-helix transcriptional regulator n=1 Tax=Salipiger sp. TaxID=2078585 RepID=UPI003A9783E4